jgi:hypothetical protein
MVNEGFKTMATKEDLVVLRSEMPEGRQGLAHGMVL